MSPWTGGRVSNVEVVLSGGFKIWVLQVEKNDDVALIGGAAWIVEVALIADWILMINLLILARICMRIAQLWNRKGYLPGLALFSSGGLVRPQDMLDLYQQPLH